jgi:hypothetical protein
MQVGNERERRAIEVQNEGNEKDLVKLSFMFVFSSSMFAGQRSQTDGVKRPHDV